MSDTFTPDPAWEDGPNGMSATLVRVVKVDDEPAVAYRATIEVDQYPDAPDFDMGCPVYRYEYRHSAEVNEAPELGDDSDAHSGVDFRAALMHFYNRAENFRTAIENTDRWLRIFHGGSIAEISHSYSQSGPDYLVYDTRKMREFWGCTGEQLETSEPSNLDWQAYIDGDVFIVTVDRTFTFDEDGEPDFDDAQEVEGPIGGHYGQEWAQQAAEEMLDYRTNTFTPNDKSLAQHRRDQSMTISQHTGDSGYPVAKVAHALADVTVYEHLTSDGSHYLVVEVDPNEADHEATQVAVYVNDAPVLPPPHRREATPAKTYSEDELLDALAQGGPFPEGTRFMVVPK